MPQFTLSDVETALSLEASGQEMIFSDIVTDTRKLQPGALFIAFKGERFNAEDFLREAADKGATGVVVSEACSAEQLEGVQAVVLRVPDTVAAYQQLAAYHRRRFDLPVIAITGSNGKTTTKDLTASVLGAGFKVLKTAANYNNEIGLPLTLLGLTAEHEAAVVEIGMRGLGQIAALAPIAEPSIAIVTNVGETHIELLGSIENIARAKAELVESVAPGGTVILNADNPFVAAMRDKVQPGVRVLTFGIEQLADIQGMNIVTRAEGATVFDCRLGGALASFRLPMAGRHNVYNALAAIAAGWALGMQPADIVQGLMNSKVTGMRFERSQKGDWQIINDAYNASPMSMAAAIDTMKEMAAGRRVLVLGDMLELGREAVAAHRRVGAKAAESGAAVLVTVGTLGREIAAGAKEAGLSEVFSVDSHEEAASVLHKILQPADTVLFKGSRGMRMEKIIDLI